MINTSDWVAHNTFGQHKWKVSYHFDCFKWKRFPLCQWFQKLQMSKWNALSLLFLECRFLVTGQKRSSRNHLICCGVSEQTIRRGKRERKGNKQKKKVNLKSWHLKCIQFGVVFRDSVKGAGFPKGTIPPARKWFNETGHFKVLF